MGKAKDKPRNYDARVSCGYCLRMFPSKFARKRHVCQGPPDMEPAQ